VSGWICNFTACVLACFSAAAASAESSPDDASEDAREDDVSRSGSFTSDPDDPQHLLEAIQERGLERDSLSPVAPLHFLHETTDWAKKTLYDAVGLDLDKDSKR
jgi:hypothetical protein